MRLPVQVHPQPDDLTCGPTCLHGVYGFFGDPLPLDRVLGEVRALDEEGGTLAVLLGAHALARGYRARILTYNLQVFDPSWFRDPGVDLAGKLTDQRKVKHDRKLGLATEAYLEFLELGGEILHEALTADVLAEPIRHGRPVIAGLSATYLYDCPREVFRNGRSVYDDVRGTPVGHFVVLAGYDPAERRFLVADPLRDNPGFGSGEYWVEAHRLLAALLLGMVTFDANILVLEPPAGNERGGRA